MIFIFCQYQVFDRGIGLWYSKMRIMNADFFVRLTLATHKVVSILPREDPLRVQVQDSANKLLVSLILLGQEQERSVIAKAVREIGELIACLNYAKRTVKINPENFIMLQREYNKVGEFLRKLHEKATVNQPVKQEPIVSNVSKQNANTATINTKSNTSIDKGELSFRQTRILELMRNKPKVQVWELQKVLPEVTKRTLRRDLDDLLQRSFIIRQGEWNEVCYQIR